ncbi:hypothetical protein HJC23_008131 [Cyclotella cryptica]|uniref:RRM domain-containing protein n=1 Tax=Cyclotella cryptica TaxID=29204 RepID=A0ABD3PK64_9STRA|eukprot:CCRYP_013960-RA/>CCRYP_013960-RA protein AED:0.03 eAED:0.03 QI:523/1/1/1/0/0.5/2/136/309
MDASPNKQERTRSFKTSSGSSLLDLHNERLKTAGRRGTKKFVDPNKLFIGNLAYDATEDDVAQLFAAYWRIPVESVRERVESIKIIRDWKTGQSKGYGFLMFYNAMDATSVMMNMRGDKFNIRGRPIRFDQGKKKGVDEDEREKKKERKKRQKSMMKDLDAEGQAIHSALEGIEGRAGETEEEIDIMDEDDMITFMEKGGLRGVMPLTEELAGYLGKEGLYEDDEKEYAEYFEEDGYSDEDLDLEEEGDEDEDNFVYDGVFEEIYNPTEYETLTAEEEEKRNKMNREQRRAADKRRKKRKLPFKGFGKP